MTVTTVRQRITDIVTEYIQQLTNGDEQRAKVHRYLPRQLNHAELPAVIVVPSLARHRLTTSDYEERDRDYLVRMFVAPLADGVSGEVEEMAEFYIDDFRRYLNKRPRLELDNLPLDTVISASISSDVGLVEAQYPNTEAAPYYLTIELRWRIVESESI